MLISEPERRDIMLNEMLMTPYMPVMPKLAEAYVPYQEYKTSYSPEEALEKGTMFPELYSPYHKDEEGGFRL